jgi:hypothetical protein
VATLDGERVEWEARRARPDRAAARRHRAHRHRRAGWRAGGRPASARRHPVRVVQPAHPGHERLAQAAAAALGMPAIFELPILNADKAR